MPYVRAVAAVASLLLTACGTGAATETPDDPSLRISAIPDQDPADLADREESMAAYLSADLDVDVEYVAVTDYAASVSLFRTGDLDLVFFGGLTGVQARLQTPGAELLAQRDIDESFHSVFIANTAAGIPAVGGVAELDVLTDTRFTFGSESSTSGRLMPEYFLQRDGVDSATDFAGAPGYSGSHDKTIKLVESGSYEAGVLSEQVWADRLAAGAVDEDTVQVTARTPGYSDYHWVAGPTVDARLGDGFTDELQEALLSLDGSDPEEADLLDAYGAKALVSTNAANYDRIESIARRLGLIAP